MHSSGWQKYVINFRSSAAKYLARLEKRVYEKITFQLLRISLWFEEGMDIVKMQGGEPDIYRLRIGNLRVIYQKCDDILTIIVVKIWPRWDVYK